MKKTSKYLKEWLHTVIYVFGLMQIFFFVREFIPPYGRLPLTGTSRIWWKDVFFSLICALVFSTSHFIINSDWLDERVSVKKRMIYCGVPCTILGCILPMHFGLQDIIPRSENVVIARVVWILSYLVSIGIYVAIFILIEKKYQKQSESYNAALEKYKKENM